MRRTLCLTRVEEEATTMATIMGVGTAAVLYIFREEDGGSLIAAAP
jgi:hypothetical protein